jgi:hypothetical protein
MHSLINRSSAQRSSPAVPGLRRICSPPAVGLLILPYGGLKVGKTSMLLHPEWHDVPCMARQPPERELMDAGEARLHRRR